MVGSSLAHKCLIRPSPPTPPSFTFVNTFGFNLVLKLLCFGKISLVKNLIYSGQELFSNISLCVYNDIYVLTSVAALTGQSLTF